MRQRPDVQAHHQRRRPLVRRQPRAQRLRGAAQHLEGAVRRLAQPGIGVERDAGLEHRRVIGRLVAREMQVGAADILEGAIGVGPAVVPGAAQRALEQLEAAPGDVGEQRVAVAEMPVRRRRADPGPARRVGEGEPGRSLLRDQVERGADQRLAQIAVMIAAPRVSVFWAIPLGFPGRSRSPFFGQLI